MTELSGSPWDIGTTHGARYADLIGSYLDDRLGLTTEETWSGAETEREVILEAAEDTLSHHERSSASLYEEMVAMAGAAGITPAEAVIVGGFTDLVDVVRSRIGGGADEHNCTSVLNPAQGFHAQTWDMHASAGEYVFLMDLQPVSGPRALVQTTTGCLGQMGMNEAGITVGINNLTSMGRPGVTWPTVVRRALIETDLERAVDVVVGAELAGGHNFMLMGPDGVGFNVEAMPLERRVTRVERSHVHTNHCVDPVTAKEEGRRLPEHVENSSLRLEVAQKLVDDVDALFDEPLISRRVADVHDVGTCGAVIMEPVQGRMRVVWGVPGDQPWETFLL